MRETETAPNNGMHPTRNSAALKLNLVSGRVMPGVMPLVEYEGTQMKVMATVALSLCFLPSSVSALVAQTRELHRVRKIYLARIVDDRGEKLPINGLLKREFEKAGFTIVDEGAQADAVLAGSIMSELPLDGDGTARPRYIHDVKLTAPNGTVLWEATIKFYSDWSDPGRMERSARKIVGRVYSDWKKSARGAGIKS